jgi:hypothetical protein
MTVSNKNERPPQDLAVPETMTIAALLAELMPPGTRAPEVEPVSLQPEPAEEIDESPIAILGSPALQLDDLDDPETLAATIPTPPPIPVGGQPALPKLVARPTSEPVVPQAPPVPPRNPIRITAAIKPGSAHGLRAAAPPLPEPPPIPPLPRLETRPTPPAPPSDIPADAAPVVELLSQLNWGNESESPAVTASTPAELTPVSTPVADPELLQIGGLTTAAFFALVNWTNDPARARIPRRSDYGLDEQTLALASQNPFYVIGQPRRPEERNVTDVLAEIAWE